MKLGYLYVLVHPSDPYLFKVGVTTCLLEKRLTELNSNYEEYAGKIVKKTGQKWEIKTYIAVTDPNWAKKVFWGALPLAPFQRGAIEVANLEWKWIEAGLNAVIKAGIRPPPKPRTTPMRNREWMLKQLEGTGISMIGRYRGLITGVEFQCVKGHIFKESAGVVAYRKSCPLCDLEKARVGRNN